MAISVFDLFKIGIGPSSSHTVGPMRAARMFALALRDAGLLQSVERIRCELFGSLGATGKGHGSDKAVLLGWEGEEPDKVDPAAIEHLLSRMREQKTVRLLGLHPVHFDERADLLFMRRETLPFHPNGMRCTAFGADGILLEKNYYSVGGGFVVSQDATGNPALLPDPRQLPYPFRSGDELLALCAEHNLSIAQLMWQNELVWNSADEVRSQLLTI